MNLRQLQYFIAVAEEQNLRRAARRLNISQPPLTRQMQQLESAIGTALFLRTRRGIRLTAAGSVLLAEARNLLSMGKVAKDRTLLAGQGRLGRLDIGVFGSSVLAIPDLLSTFRKRYPLVDVVMHALNKEEQIDALRNQRISVGFNLLGTKLDDIVSEVVRSEPLVLAVPIADALASRRRLALSDIANRPMVVFASGPRPNLVDVVYGLCRDEGFHPVTVHEVVDSIAALSLVAAGFGFCLVPQSATQLKLKGVVYRALDERLNAKVEMHCLHRRGEQSALLSAFLSTIHDHRTQRSK